MKLVAAAPVLFSLTACGGTTIEDFFSVSSTYAALNDTAGTTSTTTSTMGGVAVRVSSASDDADIVGMSGSLNHNTGKVVINDGQYSLVDSDGFDYYGYATDGSGEAVLLVYAYATQTYDYASVFAETYTVGGVNYYLTGVGGIVTQEGDMPNSGYAVYTGDAAGLGADSLGDFDLYGGTATASAYFGQGGSVDLEITDLILDDGTDLYPAGGIAFTDMTIDGNGFSGGEMTENFNYIVVGTGGEGTAEGTFFGWDQGNGTPDEIGGVILFESSDSAIYLDFIAD
ncbi:hypothetical protein BVC71_03790 [Marivivens niveibacter]|uniref:Transferrin-binding protein B C-lobe/N-lobe beta barrel domain-containing protein n=2 Tax=Marivivens niveibacter TaxID=1930667 RepID=A0A251X2S3_9RHOB|nr:hypothetical protein BVC71_03790 [Marivivens niveibacter]